jgi:hypothetical protein
MKRRNHTEVEIKEKKEAEKCNHKKLEKEGN